MPRHTKLRRRFATTLTALLVPLGAVATDLAALPEDLTELSLEELMAVEVVSVSKQAEPLQVAAGAVYVLTGEELASAGVRSIAEALRRVPGVQVARVDASQYAISARGFNATAADKLEVLLDGRSVYTPLFSGVFWDALDTPIADIDRIEVIRGPGATLWGANAVNGVINIVTRKARVDDGTLVELGGGNEMRASGLLRTSAAVPGGAVRIYVKAFELDDSRLADGGDANDGHRQAQAGFRIDVGDDASVGWTLSGDVYDGRIRDNDVLSGAAIRESTRGANLDSRLRWPALGGRMELRSYLDVSDRDIPGLFTEHRETANLDLQHRIDAGRNEWIWGAGVRHSRDRTGGPPNLIVFAPADRSLTTWNAFVQDKIAFADGRVKWTLGSKFEHNDFTGFEFQPGTRLGWEISEAWFTWAALSRAVRTPNRLDHDIAIFCPPPDGIPPFCGPGVFPIGSPQFDSEKLTALEWGLRWTDAEHWSFDLALFVNRYDDLKSAESVPLPFGSTQNRAEADSAGGEVAVVWRPAPTLELRGSYSHLALDIRVDPDSTDTQANEREDASPRHQATLSVDWQPAAAWRIAGLLRHVGELPAMQVPAYTELDLRIGWRLHPALELALVGENLLDRSHPEFGDPGPDRVEIERGLRLMLHWSPR